MRMRWPILRSTLMDRRAEIARNLRDIEERICQACARAGRMRDEVVLVGVTKTKPLSDVLTAYELGVRNFGENRVQEAEMKFPSLPADAIKHLIGPLQTNKVNKAVRLFDVIQTVDSIKLAEKLAGAAETSGRIPLPVLIEVNSGGEETKAGIPLDHIPQLLTQMKAFTHLEVRGLMTIPPPGNTRPHFRSLHHAAREFGLLELSMGMSDDYTEAIEEGATIVRVGTALFGSR